MSFERKKLKTKKRVRPPRLATLIMINVPCHLTIIVRNSRRRVNRDVRLCSLLIGASVAEHFFGICFLMPRIYRAAMREVLFRYMSGSGYHTGFPPGQVNSNGE